MIERRLRLLILGLGITIGALTSLASVHFWGGVREMSPSETAELSRLRGYCDLVRISLTTDAEDLASTDQRRQEAAAQRFFGATHDAYRSDYEIRLCAVPPPKLDARTTCWVNHDYPCLSKLAKLAADSVQATARLER
jgi:hypothetical protein